MSEQVKPSLEVDAARAHLGFEATEEAQSLVDVCLREVARRDDIPSDLAAALRGMLLRIQALNGVAMSILTCDNRTNDDIHFEVHGAVTADEVTCG